jgi:hypothetical protein
VEIVAPGSERGLPAPAPNRDLNSDVVDASAWRIKAYGTLTAGQYTVSVDRDMSGDRNISVTGPTRISSPSFSARGALTGSPPT